MTTNYPQIEATSENQSEELTKLNDILTQIQTTAANQTTEIAKLTSILAAFASLATAANQSSEISSLASILAAFSPLATGANQTTEIARLTSILSALSPLATASNQSTQITSLASILAAFTPLSTAANQATQTTKLSNLLIEAEAIDSYAAAILGRMSSGSLNPLSPVSVKTASAEILAKNADRKGFYLFNTGSNAVYITLGDDPATTSVYIQAIPANSGWGMLGPSLVWMGVVAGIRASGSADVVIYEFI